MDEATYVEPHEFPDWDSWDVAHGSRDFITVSVGNMNTLLDHINHLYDELHDLKREVRKMKHG